jgi:GT2 family glycosyltransferase
VSFDPSFPYAGEDRDWCHRLGRAGFEIVRVRGAVVMHRHELTLRSFVRKHADYGEGSRRFRATSASGANSAGWYLALLRRGFRRGVGAGVLVGIAQVAGIYGAARARM